MGSVGLRRCFSERSNGPVWPRFLAGVPGQAWWGGLWWRGLWWKARKGRGEEPRFEPALGRQGPRKVGKGRKEEEKSKRKPKSNGQLMSCGSQRW